MNYSKILYCYIPLPKKERDAYLGRVRSLVEKYKPMIEEETGINLGDVSIKELRYIFKDATEKFKSTGRINEDLELTKTNLFLFRLIGGLFRLYKEDVTQMIYSNSTLYVPSGMPTKANIIFDEENGKGMHLDKIVIHELSHHLWDLLETANMPVPARHKGNSEKSVYMEGFASYCEKDRFRRFYTEKESVSDSFWDGRVYKNGRNKVKKLVQIYGEEVLIKIPTEWEFLDSQLRFHRFQLE